MKRRSEETLHYRPVFISIPLLLSLRSKYSSQHRVLNALNSCSYRRAREFYLPVCFNTGLHSPNLTSKEPLCKMFLNEILYILMHATGLEDSSISTLNVKVVPVLNQAPCHEDVLGSGGVTPHFLDLGTRWR